jgi:hypothetical protein
LRQACGNEFLRIFLVFGAFHFPFKFPVKELQIQNRKIVLFPALAPTSSFGAGFEQEKLLPCQRI